jgi:hypothetical protein
MTTKPRQFAVLRRLTAAYELNDFEFGSGRDFGFRPLRLFYDHTVQFHGDSIGPQAKVCQ